MFSHRKTSSLTRKNLESSHPELAVDDVEVLVAEVGRHAVDVVLGVKRAEGREEAA